MVLGSILQSWSSCLITLCQGLSTWLSTGDINLDDLVKVLFARHLHCMCDFHFSLKVFHQVQPRLKMRLSSTSGIGSIYIICSCFIRKICLFLHILPLPPWLASCCYSKFFQLWPQWPSWWLICPFDMLPSICVLSTLFLLLQDAPDSLIFSLPQPFVSVQNMCFLFSHSILLTDIELSLCFYMHLVASSLAFITPH